MKSGGEVKNKEDFMNLDKACQFLDSVKWVSVVHCVVLKLG